MSPRLSASVPLDHLTEEEELAATATASRRRLALSFEVIPPRHDADEAKVAHLLQVLERYHPDYIAVTSSQSSGWLEGTTAFIKRVADETTMRPLAHLACTAGNAQELDEWIDNLVDSGVRGLLALRGDLPPGGMPADHLQHADELVRLIHRKETEQAARFAAGRLAVAVACYPNGHAESASEDEDFDVLLAKQRCGADLAISQLFFDPQDFLSFVERARLAGVHIPLIPGIMPMTSIRRLERMGQLSGLSVPPHVRAQLEAAKSPEQEQEIGMELTAELARTIVDAGINSLHIYTHNNAEVTEDLLNRIGVKP